MTYGSPLPPKPDLPFHYGSVNGLNYSLDYIANFHVAGPHEMNGGGGGIHPAVSGVISGAGERCCIVIPTQWHTDLEVNVEWVRDRKPFDYEDSSGVAVMTAKARIPRYGARTFGLWAVFLPGDRVKVVVMDDSGNNAVRTIPPDDDPFVAQGTPDEQLTAEYLEKRK